MAIYSFSPFGYEGALITVEVDLRRGIPAVDIVGLADRSVVESRERVRSAIRNSGFEFPNERVLLSLSPADLKKDGNGFDLAIALSIIKASKLDVKERPDFISIGELEISGNVRPVRGVYAALQKAVASGIPYAIIPDVSDDVPDGIRVAKVSSLKDAVNAMIHIGEEGFFKESGSIDDDGVNVEFDGVEEDSLDSIKGHDGLKFAMAVAVAGRHSLLAYGAPGCGKTLVLQRMTELLPHLTNDERKSTQRIHSLAGLLSPNQRMERRPFRMLHQTTSIEGMCGGGANCRPGEISLANNGVLFLDEAAEFRSSVLQMLRVPLESHCITLSRAGRSTVYPARFQLVMTMNPCPCGNYGNPEKVCLCSAKSVEQYWRKLSRPLIDRIGIRFNMNQQDWFDGYSLNEMREMIRKAWKLQYERQGKLNQDLTPNEVAEHCKIGDDSRKLLEKCGFSNREMENVLKIARTFADMNPEKNDDDDDWINVGEVEEAIELHGRLPDIVEESL